jgi:hypothetical protein
MRCRFISREALWRFSLKSLATLLLGLGVTYALLGKELFRRAGAVFDQMVLKASEASSARRLAARASGVAESRAALAELHRHRNDLEDQVRKLEVQKAEIANCLRRDRRLLHSIQSVLDGQAVPDSGMPSPAEVERDLADVLLRIQAHRRQLSECDAALRRLSPARSALDRQAVAARRLLQQRAHDLHRQQALFTGRQAYLRGLESIHRLEEAERIWHDE